MAQNKRMVAETIMGLPVSRPTLNSGDRCRAWTMNINGSRHAAAGRLE